MSNERRQVLEMLAQGKISAEDADRLLEKLESGGGTGAGESEKSEPGDGQVKKTLRFLRIVVNSPSGENVNVRVPLIFVKAGIKLSAVMPAQAREKLEQKGVDLSALSRLSGDELIEALREMTIDVDSPDGETVKVYCE